ncbi:hypothetical protein [Stieleria magnilauensis]|uniref:hypothetical protein n=1 Tax=Stieleria magnilauensis TaxID=2527963 RepID=UPI003AF9A22A
MIGIVELSDDAFELRQATIDLFEIEDFVTRSGGGCKGTVDRTFVWIDQFLVDRVGDKRLMNVINKLPASISEIVPGGT